MGTKITKILFLTVFIIILAGCQNDKPSKTSPTSTGDNMVDLEELDNQVPVNTDDIELEDISQFGADDDLDMEVVILEADLIPTYDVLEEDEVVIPIMSDVIESDLSSLEEDVENKQNQEDTTPNLVVNNVPDVMGENIILLEDQSITLSNLLDNDSDQDADDINIIDFSRNSIQGGSLELVSANVLKYTPAENFNGSDSFAYVVSDDQGAHATAIVNVTVEPINDMPQLTGEEITILEDESILLMGLVANDFDEDGDDLSIQNYSQGKNGGAIELISSNVLRYAPEANYFGTDSFTYTVTDGNKNLVTATVNVLVKEVNDAPSVTDEVVTVLEDSSILLSGLLDNDKDIDEDQLMISSFEQSQNFGVVELVKENVLRYTPAADFSGIDSFKYSVSDSRGGKVSGTVTVIVSEVNDIPVAKVDAFNVKQGQSQEVNILANDLGVSEDIKISIVSLPMNGNVEVTVDGKVIYTPKDDYFGTDSFIYQVKDKDDETSVATAAIDVECVTNCSRVFNISWEQSASADVTSYKVYYGTDAANLDQVVALGNVTNYDHFVDVKGEYYFALSAVNGQDKESKLTDVVIGVF